MIGLLRNVGRQLRDRLFAGESLRLQASRRAHEARNAACLEERGSFGGL